MFDIRSDVEIIKENAFKDTVYKVFVYYFLPSLALLAHIVARQGVFYFCCGLIGSLCVCQGIDILKNDKHDGLVLISILVYLAYAYFLHPLIAIPLTTLTVSLPLFFSIYLTSFTYKGGFLSGVIVIALLALNIYTLDGSRELFTHATLLLDILYVISFAYRWTNIDEVITCIIYSACVFALISYSDYSDWVVKSTTNDILATFIFYIFIEKVFFVLWRKRIAKKAMAYTFFLLRSFMAANRKTP